jgi:hypothetical protein
LSSTLLDSIFARLCGRTQEPRSDIPDRNPPAPSRRFDGYRPAAALSVLDSPRTRLKELRTLPRSTALRVVS